MQNISVTPRDALFYNVISIRERTLIDRIEQETRYILLT